MSVRTKAGERSWFARSKTGIRTKTRGAWLVCKKQKEYLDEGPGRVAGLHGAKRVIGRRPVVRSWSSRSKKSIWTKARGVQLVHKGQNGNQDEGRGLGVGPREQN